jgi:hypothetical protein
LNCSVMKKTASFSQWDQGITFSSPGFDGIRRELSSCVRRLFGYGVT